MTTESTPGALGSNDQLGLAPERAGQPRMMTIIDGEQEDETGHWYSPAAVREMLDAETANLRAALKWYADGMHFDKASPDAWDTVSGEPQNQGLKIETLLRGINDARALIDPIWRHRMGAEQVREHVQRGLRCIDSAITDCQFTAPTAVHASDCAMHNAPAYPAGECDCGALGPNVGIEPPRSGRLE